MIDYETFRQYKNYVTKYKCKLVELENQMLKLDYYHEQSALTFKEYKNMKNKL